MHVSKSVIFHIHSFVSRGGQTTQKIPIAFKWVNIKNVKIAVLSVRKVITKETGTYSPVMVLR